MARRQRGGCGSNSGLALVERESRERLKSILIFFPFLVFYILSYEGRAILSNNGVFTHKTSFMNLSPNIFQVNWFSIILKSDVE